MDVTKIGYLRAFASHLSDLIVQERNEKLAGWVRCLNKKNQKNEEFT